MNNRFLDQLKKYSNLVNQEIDVLFNDLKLNSNLPEIVLDGMKYAVSGGGKRIRPVLALATAKMLNLDQELVLKYALGIEFIHSYSLVHDDLPEMDNDDYRRGKLSTHKKFGQANAILIGDALLNFAFEYLLSNIDVSGSKRQIKNQINAINFLASCSGYKGMIAGQFLDLLCEKENKIDKNVLYDIYENKTGKLILAPVMCVCILNNNKYYKKLYKFAYNLGVLFQFQDDILDCESNFYLLGKTPNKDIDQNKLTAVKVFGVKRAKQYCKRHYLQAINSIKSLKDNQFLLDFAQYIYNRKS